MHLLTLKNFDGFLYEFSPRIAGLETKTERVSVSSSFYEINCIEHTSTFP